LQLSLIIAVYNKPEILRYVLAACARQSFQDFEVIIADDGSGREVKDVVMQSKEIYNFSITHLWHDDIGWRKNKMLNNSIRAAKSDYLVFIDGDCLPEKDFLLDHWREKETKKILLGRRVEMSERWANSLTLAKVSSGQFEKIGIAELVDGFRGSALRLEEGIRIRSQVIRNISFRHSKSILGSNFSVHKVDMFAINGFDEEYDGPGHGEDSDVQYRLSLIGVAGKSLRNLAIQFHVYHPRTKPSEQSAKRFEEIRKIIDPKCKCGLENL
ncbi:MAG: glycosyltransferase, partial [Candidatus Kryptoniota bacterium]